MPDIIRISDLIADPQNANRGTDRGAAAIERSMRANGFGRPTLADRNGTIIAGNKTIEAAMRAGIEKIRVIETDGDEVIVHKRMDLDLSCDPKARSLALADNRISDISHAPDMDLIRAQVAEYQLDIEEIGYTAEELYIAEASEPETVDEAKANGQSEEPKPKSDDKPVGEHFDVVVQCQNERDQRVLYERLVAEGFACRLLTL
jgi:ParB-like chromosome segregation protein Spo0J